MNCESRRESIALYAGGDLSAAESQAVERHLAECVECAALEAELRADRALVVADFEAPDFAAMRRDLRAAIVRRRIVRFSAVGALAAAALMAILIREPKPAPVHVAKAPVAAPPVVAAVGPGPVAPMRRAAVRRKAVAKSEQARVAMFLATRDPRVNIMLLPVKQEISNE